MPKQCALAWRGSRQWEHGDLKKFLDQSPRGKDINIKNTEQTFDLFRIDIATEKIRTLSKDDT